MSGMVLSPELCSRIVQWCRRTDLLALCLTCKLFQREAEIRLYESLSLGDSHKAQLACRSLINCERLGPLVHHFYIYQDARRLPLPSHPYASLPPLPTSLPHQFWLAIKNTLPLLRNLKVIFISDPTLANTWILDNPQIKFQLREAKFRFLWDAHVVKFLQSQRKLKTLQTADAIDDHPRLGLTPGSLGELQVFDGPMLVAAQLLPSSPLTHLQVTIDVETASKLLPFLPRLAKVHKTLRALSLIDIPEELIVKAVHIISTACPTLLHIGVLPLPWHGRHKLTHSLIHLHHLFFLELDVSRWNPQPNTAAQRALSSELRMYRPTLRFIIFWVGTNRFSWSLEGEDWCCRLDSNQHPHYETAWCRV